MKTQRSHIKKKEKVASPRLTPAEQEVYWLHGTLAFSQPSWGFPDISVGEESACNVRDLGSIPGSGRSTGEGNRYPLQLSGLENSMDCMVCEVTNSQTRLSDFHFKNKDHEAEFI